MMLAWRKKEHCACDERAVGQTHAGERITFAFEPGNRNLDYPDATAVFDVDSIGLTNLVTRLNHGGDIGGQPIGAPTAFHIGVSVNPSASNMDEEFRRFDYKVEAGAEFVITRPVFDLSGFERCLKRIESAR